MTIVRQPTCAGVRDAAAKIAATLPPTPLFVSEIKGVAVAFKAESLQPVGAFKIRGAWHRLTALDDAAQRAGVVAFSSGNHAQGIAWAARKLGIAVTIVMPADAPAAKLEGTLALGAEVVRYGPRDGEPRDDRRQPRRRTRRNVGAELRRSLDHRGAGELRDRGTTTDGVDGSRRTRAYRRALRRRRVWLRGSRWASLEHALPSPSPKAGTTCAAAWRRAGSSPSAQIRRRPRVMR